MSSNLSEFAEMLTGGKQNSLGRTLEVVEAVEAQPSRLAELFSCYQSTDEIVRLRVSNALKRLIRAQPARFHELAEDIIRSTMDIPQESTRWTMAQLIGENLPQWRELSQELRDLSLEKLFRNFEISDDWIVINGTLKTLANIGVTDGAVEARLRPLIERYQDDKRKSVSNTAHKAERALDTGKAIK